MRHMKAVVAGAALLSALYVGYAIPAASRTASSHSPTKHVLAGHTPSTCPVKGIDPVAAQPLDAAWSPPSAGKCKPRMINGYLVPDATCTPGAINPTLTLAVLQNPKFRTGLCVRDNATSPAQKDKTYGWYGIPKPPHNTGQTQTCEKDHLISLELGGGDTLANIWPQCGPSHVALKQRYFKQKDLVENYLADQVKDGAIPLEDAQHGIASDWTQYIDAATAYYKAHASRRIHPKDS